MIILETLCFPDLCTTRHVPSHLHFQFMLV